MKETMEAFVFQGSGSEVSKWTRKWKLLAIRLLRRIGGSPKGFLPLCPLLLRYRAGHAYFGLIEGSGGGKGFRSLVSWLCGCGFIV